MKNIKYWLFLLCLFLFIGGAASISMYYLQGRAQDAKLRQLTELKNHVEPLPSQPFGEEASISVAELLNNPETGLLREYEELHAKNGDMVGWINVPNTKIDYPIMQRDREFYLKRNFEKKYSPYGLPFVDVRCDVDEPSQNILIYGHNIKGGNMFRELLNYKEESFYLENSVISLDTLHEKRSYEVVFALFYEDVILAQDIGIYESTLPETETELQVLLDELDARSLYRAVAKVALGDELLTLSTCSYHSENGRFLVIAKRVLP